MVIMSSSWVSMRLGLYLAFCVFTRWGLGLGFPSPYTYAAVEVCGWGAEVTSRPAGRMAHAMVILSFFPSYTSRVRTYQCRASFGAGETSGIPIKREACSVLLSSYPSHLTSSISFQITRTRNLPSIYIHRHAFHADHRCRPLRRHLRGWRPRPRGGVHDGLV